MDSIIPQMLTNMFHICKEQMGLKKFQKSYSIGAVTRKISSSIKMPMHRTKWVNDSNFGQEQLV